ncbi:MAG: efflux RND transporter permease subunit [Leptospiraceae bacterium]|jgi:multidrug efflux pump subunit AcrB|nr:efflux RND transporter permease subunit [Leptospiraceae bacterium]
MLAIIEFFLRRSIFGNILTVILIGWGIYVGLTINREAFPNIDFDIVLVTTVFPGASPEEVEKLITNPIEDQLKSVEGIKEIRSSSIENRSGITVIIDPDTKNPRKVVEDIRSAVDRVTDLPADVDKPLVLEITSSLTPVIEVSLFADENKIDYRTLREQAEILENALKQIDGVARIDRRGWLNREYIVKLDPIKIKNNYVGIEQILAGLKQRNINFPGGEVIINGASQVLRTVGELLEPKDVENFFIRSNELGQGIRIRDVGKVVDGFEEPLYIYRTNGKIAINLIVLKKEKGDIIRVVEEVKKVANNYKQKLPEGIEVEFINDLSYYVKRRLNVLFNNAIGGFILVVGSLFFFMGWRTALMVALGIPVSLGAAMIIFNALGVTLNLISMVGMIIVVGILVDDAIVVSENFYRYLEEGYSTLEAAIKGTSEVVAPVFASVITTIVSFAPLLFVTGIFGKFLFTIPLVVIITLSASLFESFFILPSHLYDINKYASHENEIKGESGYFYRFRKKIYEPALAWIINHRWQTLIALVVLFITSIVLQVTVGKFKLFTGAIEAFIIKMKADPSTPLEDMDRFNQYISKYVETLPKEEIENFRTATGIVQQNPTDPFTKRGSNYAMAIIYLTPENKRKRSGEEIVNQVREEISWLLDAKFKDNANLKQNPYKPKIFPEFMNLSGKLENLQVDLLRGGPPTGKPVAIEIRGKDYDVLEKIGEEFKERLAKIKGVKNIDDDHELGKKEIHLKIDELTAAITGVSVENIALAVNTAFRGTAPTTIKKGTEEIDVRVRFDDSYHKNIQTINHIYVLNRMGQLIPIKPLVKFETKQGYVALNHIDADRSLIVLADIDEKTTTSAQVNKEIQKFMNQIIEKYPGYTVKLGGENKDTEESLESLRKALIVGVIVNFLILSSLFGSILLPFTILMTIPFAIIGVILAFIAHGQPISFLALVGFVGLSGVVVNDAIVMIDFAQSLRKNNPNMSIEEVALNASSMRLRAIILTTLTTVLGLLPTAYGIGGSDPFLVPLALAFAWGLMFSTLLTLFIIPVLYIKAVNFTIFIKKLLKLKEH